MDRRPPLPPPEPPFRWVATVVLLATAGYAVATGFGLLFAETRNQGRVQELLALAGCLAALYVLYGLRRPRAAALLTLVTVGAELMSTVLETGSVDSTAVVALPVVMASAGLVSGPRVAAALAVTAGTAIAASPFLHGTWPADVSRVPPPALHHLVVVELTLAAAAVLARSTVRLYGEALTASEEARARYAQLFEGAPDGLAVLDAAGAVLTVNAATERLLGQARAALRGRPFADALVGAGAARAPDLAGVAPGDLLPLDLAGGTAGVRQLEVTLRRVGEGADRALVILRDVTERRAVEQRLQHAQRLETVGRLAGGVAHDFNNLLTAVGGNAELLAAKQDPDTVELARAILDSQRRGSDLTRQLLAFARRDRRSPEPVDAAAAVRGMERLLVRLMREQHRLALRCEGPAIIEADRGQLEQVVVNLVANARDAMPGGGEVALAVRAVPAAEAAALGSRLHRPRQVLIEVADHGVGMSAETAARVFEPFFTTKPRGQGTGLGLSTVHGIVTESGGHVAVDSAPGQGARFRVFFPASEAPERRPAAAPPEPAPGHGERVLLVEDEDAVRALARRLLEEAGYRVSEAADGDGALALPGPFDVLLTDVLIPGPSGPELARRLRAGQPRLRVVFMSGYVGQGDARGQLGPGDRLVRKPFSAAELLGALRAELDAVLDGRA